MRGFEATQIAGLARLHFVAVLMLVVPHHRYLSFVNILSWHADRTSFDQAGVQGCGDGG